MKRQVELLPTSVVFNEGDQDPNGSPYGGSPTYTVDKVWADESADTYWYDHPVRTTTMARRAVCGWQPPPTLAIFTKVSFVAVWDYAQNRANNWDFPPTNAYGPRLSFVLRNRAGTDYLYSSAYEIGSGGGKIDWEHNNYRFDRTGGGDLYTGPITTTWEAASHPEGGPWTLDDLIQSHFAAGVRIETANPAFEDGNFNKVRVIKLRVLLDIEDLGGFVANIRHAASMALRFFRRARNAIVFASPARETKGGLYGRVELVWPGGPSVEGGWGRRPLERRAGLIVQRKIAPESMKVTDEVFDLRPYSCLGWAQYRIYDTWTPELTGLALLDKGGGFTHSRDQDAWSPREGDGVLLRVLADYPNLSREGLACAGAGDTEKCLYNFDMMQSGWSTVGSSGAFSATADTNLHTVEEQGFLSSCALSYGGPGGKGGRARSLGSLASGRLHVRVVVKNSTVPTPATQFAEWYLTNGSQYWDAAGRAWSGSPVYNPIPSDAPYGESVSDDIPVSGTYTIAVGRFSTNLSMVVINVGVVNCQYTDGTVGGTRPPLVALGSGVVRVADEHSLSQSPSHELWSFDRGVAMAEFRPWWRAEGLPADSLRPILQGHYTRGVYDTLYFVAGSTDVIRFRRTGITDFDFDCPLDRHVNRSHAVRAWARWLGSQGWTEYGPLAITVGWAIFDAETGEYLASASATGTLPVREPQSARDKLYVGCDVLGNALDGWVRTWEVRRDPLHEDEIVWRL